MDRQSTGARLGDLVGLRRGLHGSQGSLKEEGQQEEEPFPTCHDERPFLEDTALCCRRPWCDRATACSRSLRLMEFGLHDHTTYDHGASNSRFPRIKSRVGKGRPAGSLELWVSPSPSKIPYGGFSPVRLQMDRQQRPSTTSRA